MDYVPQGFHKLLGKVAVTKEEVVLKCGEVIKQAKFLGEDLKEASRGGVICAIDAALETCDIAVLEDYERV
jgi:hypothetical protein